MQNVMNMSKRVISAAIAAATIAFSVGAGALVAPSSAKAASMGSLIKGSSFSAVYYYGWDGMRYTFPNLTVYNTWYPDFSGVVTVSDAELTAIQLGANVTMRPGSYWIKVQSDPKVYAVARNGAIHWIESESVATGLAGSDWNKRIVDVADVFFANYTPSTSLMTAKAYEGMVYAKNGANYLVWDGKSNMVSSDAMTANRFNSSWVMDGASIDDSALVAGNAISGVNSAWSDVSQTGVTQSTTSPSAVTASLASDSPAAGIVVQTQAAADMAHISFSGSGTVTSVTLSRTGISDQNTLSNVYLYDGNTRLTDGYSFNSSSTLTMNGLSIAVSGSKTISVRADVGSSTNAPSGQTVAIGMTSFMLSGATAATTSGVMGNTMTVASGSSLASAWLSSNTVSSSTVNAGTTGYTVWSAPLQVNTRALLLKSANFRMTGSAPSDALSNVTLYVDGIAQTGSARVISINGSNYQSFDFSAAPVSLATGSHTVEVRATIEKGSSFSVTLALSLAADMMLTDSQAGVDISVLGASGATFSANTAGTISISSGSVTVSADPTFLTYTNISGGASNVAIAKFKLHGYGEDVKVNTLTITPSLLSATAGSVSTNGSGVCSAAASCGLQNVTLYFNGVQVGSQQNWTSTTTSYGSLTFSPGSQMIVPAGVDSTLEVRADIRTTGGTTYTAGTVTASMGIGSSNGEGQTSKTTTNVPGSNTSGGNSLTIQTGNLAVSKNSGFASQNISPNVSGVKVGSYVLQNQSSSESTRVTSLVVNLAYTVVGSTNYSALRTSETSGNASTPVQPSTAAAASNANNTFSTDFTLAPGASRTIDVYVDTSSATSGTLISSLTVTSIGTTSNVSTTASAVTGQTMTIGVGTIATPTFITSSSTTAQYVAAAGGAEDATRATYNFLSTSGASTISELKFTVTGTDTVTAVKVGSISAAPVSGVVWLTGLSLAVPNGGAGLNVDALVSYSSVGTTGIAPGTTSSIALTYVKYTSGTTTTTITPSVSAPTMTLVGSKPTVSVSGTAGTGLVVGGAGKLSEVTVAADNRGNIRVRQIRFTLATSGFSTAPTTYTSLSLRSSDNTAIADFTCTEGAVGVITCVTAATYAADYTITAGSSKTFVLYGTNDGANTGTGVPTVTSTISQANFVWDDTSTSGASGTALTGTLLYNFPVSSYTIKQ
jgi:hypothetical protein